MGLRSILHKRPKGGLAFLQIPKTGGTYLAQHESQDKRPIVGTLRRLRHACVVDTKHPRRSFPPKDGIIQTISLEKLRGFYVFTTVRKPFDGPVGYAGHAGGCNPKYHDPSHYDYKNVQKGFDYLLRAIANREDIWLCRKFLFFQMFCDNGGLVVDWINRAEQLDEDLAKLKGSAYRREERQRQGKRGDYREYYDDKLIDLVTSVWGRELRLFGYDFDRLDMAQATLKCEVDRETKSQVQYFWDRNELLFNGTLIR